MTRGPFRPSGWKLPKRGIADQERDFFSRRQCDLLAESAYRLNRGHSLAEALADRDAEAQRLRADLAAIAHWRRDSRK